MDKEILEQWRDVTGYEGLYQVSNLGKVKSLGRFRNNGNPKVVYWMNEKVLVNIQEEYMEMVSLVVRDFKGLI